MNDPYYADDAVTLYHGDARKLPIEDDTVDLVVTSPPYFALRSYTDDGEHYAGQVGSEATPAAFIEALMECTAEMVRVLKPSGSIFVNLGDKYAGPNMGGPRAPLPNGGGAGAPLTKCPTLGAPTKSLIGIPWRYALACIDDLGLILRAELIWSKPNGLPESVTDRVRRSHEQWFHFTVAPRYFSAVDEIREKYELDSMARSAKYGAASRGKGYAAGDRNDATRGGPMGFQDASNLNPLGKLPGSVWTVPTQPLTVPAHLGVDHFAAFPMEWPRRLIAGWCPAAVCTACGDGRRPVRSEGVRVGVTTMRADSTQIRGGGSGGGYAVAGGQTWQRTDYRITGYICACPTPTAPATPGVVLDPFGGTGTTALVARVLGRHGISVDLSADYCRLAQWRTTDRGEIARAMCVDKPPVQCDGQDVLDFDEVPA